MSTQRKRLPVTSEKKPPVVDKYPARRFPIQHEIQKLGGTERLNERIADLENECHRGHAMEVSLARSTNFAAY